MGEPIGLDLTVVSISLLVLSDVLLPRLAPASGIALVVSEFEEVLEPPLQEQMISAEQTTIIEMSFFINSV